MPTIIKASIFRSIQIVLFPVAVVGYGMFLFKLILFSSKRKMSFTALAPLWTRWMHHQLGIRPDLPCEQLLRILPNVSYTGLCLATYGTRLACRLAGYLPGRYRSPYEGNAQMAFEPYARTLFFDAALARHLHAIEQLVILGAGFDTRAYQMPSRIHCFEVDAPNMQQTKCQMLEKAGLDTTQVRFVAADFRTEDWLEKLVMAEFDPQKKTFFLWEGVTMYLDQAVVEDTLLKIAGTASGSIVAFDYFHANLIEAKGLYMRFAHFIVNTVSEPFRFGLKSHVGVFLKEYGFSLEAHENFGPETEQKPSVAGFAAALVVGS